MNYVLLLNWNGWRDTCECLESLVRLVGEKPKIVVCDNHSHDGSLDHIRAWARGDEISRLPAWWAVETGAGMGETVSHAASPVASALRLAEVRLVDGGGFDCDQPDADLFLLPTGANLGFAGGCNVGLRFILTQPAARSVWLLNNDTVVAPQALQMLVNEARTRPGVGMVGSVLRYYHRPEVVQALGGGRLDLQRTATMHVGEGTRFAELDASIQQQTERELAYITGASLLVTREFLETVGLMQEDYFLYYEEIDWAERARRSTPAFSMALAKDSMVFHKEGASAGTNSRSVLSSRLLARNRLRFIKRFYPAQLGRARRHVLRDALVALVKGRWRIAWSVAMISCSPVRI
ncbi:glycosyltransferase family 2 protein [uncultured Sphaerotilus sp.]|uniref:glycosyltransferase family 2 protein n=1 Tax=uncultured Sphaerotilus sp. TaxID=474984 RepID=UPI0030CA16AA